MKERNTEKKKEKKKKRMKVPKRKTVCNSVMTKLKVINVVAMLSASRFRYPFETCCYGKDEGRGVNSKGGAGSKEC